MYSVDQTNGARLGAMLQTDGGRCNLDGEVQPGNRLTGAVSTAGQTWPFEPSLAGETRSFTGKIAGPS